MDAIDTIANHRQTLENELNKFILNYEGVQGHLIGVLARKIDWMCTQIGCPSSVKPMLKSIVNGKVKKWSDYDDKGKQLTGLHITEIQRKYNQDDVITGHFRWDFKGWKADRYTRDYINYFYFGGRKPKALYSGIRFKIKRFTVSKNSDNLYFINITTPKSNDYRYFYYIKENKFICNCGGDLTKQEKDFVLKAIKSEFKDFNIPLTY